MSADAPHEATKSLSGKSHLNFEMSPVKVRKMEMPQWESRTSKRKAWPQMLSENSLDLKKRKKTLTE